MLTVRSVSDQNARNYLSLLCSKPSHEHSKNSYDVVGLINGKKKSEIEKKNELENSANSNYILFAMAGITGCFTRYWPQKFFL
jgi:hypothetical protein